MQIVQIPDKQTQFAQLMVGGLDLASVPTRDQADALAQNPEVRLSAIKDIALYSVVMDAAGRSGNPAFSDLRVRNADVEKAKALLTEAGYPIGIDTEITALPGNEALAEGIAGELRKIGIRGSVVKTTYNSWRQRQTDNKMQLAVMWLPIRSSLDASGYPSYHFERTPRNYTGDSILTQWVDDGLTELDAVKRKAIYRKINDRNIAMMYILPLASVPDVYAHAKDLEIIPTTPTPRAWRSTSCGGDDRVARAGCAGADDALRSGRRNCR